jgi:sec-independent protein translocase protein TatB
MVVILIIALLIFGPRKLPELAKSLGKGLAELRRTSSDLKDTLEREITVEESKKKLEASPPEDRAGETVATTPAAGVARQAAENAAPDSGEAPGPPAGEETTPPVRPADDSPDVKD